MLYVSKCLCEFYYKVLVPNSLNSHISSVSILIGGLNLPNWNEKIQFHLDVLDLDLVILEEKLLLLMMLVAMKRKPIIKLENDLTDSN